MKKEGRKGKTGRSLIWRKGLVCPFCTERISSDADGHMISKHPTIWEIYAAYLEFKAWGYPRL